MKLTYRDKVILGAILALALLIVGFFVWIKPEMDDISTNKDTLTVKQSDRDKVDAQIAEIPGIKTDIQKIYSDSKTFTDPFLEWNSIYDTHKVDQYMQQFANENHAHVKITNLLLNDVTAGRLGYYYFTPVFVGEDLRTSVDINGDDAKEMAALKAESDQLADRTEEQVLYATYNVTVSGEKADLWNYMKEIEKQPKTILVNNITFSNLDIKEVKKEEDKDKDKDEDDEKKETEVKKTPTAQFTITLYSVYEMDEPKLD